MNALEAPEFSFIVPVYGAETYLRACIGSILAQSLQNFELLLIDDGSKDRCPEICDEAAEKDPRIRVFHRENRGVSAARNFGLTRARGTYVLFVDADDLIAPDYLQKLFSALPGGKQDAISVCPVNLMNGDMIKSRPEPLTPWKKGEGSLYDYWLEPLIAGRIQGSSCRALFPVSLLREKGITFAPCKIAEDLLFFLEVLTHCSGIGVCPEALYTYRQFDGSSSHRNYITGYLPDRLTYLKKLREILESAPAEEAEKQALLCFSFQFYRMLLYMNAAAAEDPRKEIGDIDRSPFGKEKVPAAGKRAFFRQLKKKHKILSVLVSLRMFSLIARIREAN